MEDNKHYSSIMRVFYFIFLSLVVFFIPTPSFAQSHTTRLQIPLHKSTVIIEKRDGTGAEKILVHDYLSSTKAVITESGAVSTYPSYYPYGSSIEQTSVDMANRQYTGQQKVSDDSSVYNYNARYYNPTSALFIQPDSVRGPGRYSYVAGNPVQATDPSGHDLCQQDKSLAFLWKAVGQCGGAEGEDFMGEEGLGSVGTVMAAAEAASGGIGGVAAWIGDKVTGSTSGSQSVNSAYASLSGGAGAGILSMGMMSPDPGDAGRGGNVVKRLLGNVFGGNKKVAAMETLQDIREEAFSRLMQLDPNLSLSRVQEVTNDARLTTRALMIDLGLTADSRMYRWSDPEYIDTQRGLAKANRNSVAEVADEYTYGVNPMFGGMTVGQVRNQDPGLVLGPRVVPQARFLNVPSLNVLPFADTTYAKQGRMLFSFRLGDALEQGGRIYRDRDSFMNNNNPLIITIPQGCVACTRHQ